MSKQILAFAAIVAVTSFLIFNMETKNSTISQFESFKSNHGKFYMTAEENAYRKSVFMMNLAKINAHNADKTQTYTMGINQFSDLTQDEFVSTYLGASVNKKFTDGTEGRTLVDSPIVGDVDWTSVGKVTEVKNQGGCGSCWAFSAVGAIESAYLIQKGATLNLAEQQLVDCSRSYGNNGCGGGWMDSAFAYVRDHGLVQTSQYAYVARDQTCKIDSGEYRVSGFKDVAGCENLSNALSTGPVSVAVDATNWSPYRDGIFNNCATNVNHGVLAVGETGSYWKVKNSWSTSWGEKGFIRVAKGNTCAICTYPSYLHCDDKNDSGFIILRINKILIKQKEI